MIGTERKFVIGRDASCDVVLADDSVSRRHAELLVFDDGMLFAPAALRLRCDQDRGPAVSHLRALSAALGRLGAATRRIVPLLEDRVGPRWTPIVLAIALWLLLVLLLTLTLALGNPAPQAFGHRAGVLLLDRWATAFPYPLTVQNLQHLLFAIALGELWVGWKRAGAEMDALAQGYLPEDEQTMLQAEALGPIRRRLLGRFDADSGFLSAMIDLCVLQFFASRSVDQAISVLGSKQALIAHQVVLRHRASRALAWSVLVAASAGVAPPSPAAAAAEPGRTERLVRRQTGIDPVVGWLVCTAGPERGSDYRLHSERNFIGRGEAMDVRIAGDKTISRENHLSLSFDPNHDSFRLLPGEGRGLVYLNGDELVSPTLL